jgi:hypothetical protein
MSSETQTTHAVDDPTQLWLRTHLPQAERWYRLWLANAACVGLARAQAPYASTPEQGRLLLLANVDARTVSALEYLGHLSCAEERTRRALTAHDAPADTVMGLQAKRARLVELMSAVSADALESPMLVGGRS